MSMRKMPKFMGVKKKWFFVQCRYLVDRCDYCS